ncbi:MAG: hypothetical protein AAFN00_18555, partial [Cyanobacteria bacterium J06558_2]
ENLKANSGASRLAEGVPQGHNISFRTCWFPAKRKSAVFARGNAGVSPMSNFCKKSECAKKLIANS